VKERYTKKQAITTLKRHQKLTVTEEPEATNDRQNGNTEITISLSFSLSLSLSFFLDHDDEKTLESASVAITRGRNID
jgi:hypothetical protein